MKRLIEFVIVITMGVALAGCGATTKEMARMTNSTRTDVFIEVPAEGTAPAGFADLVIKASIKTPVEGYYIFESKTSAYGKLGYNFLVNIDGQAVLWKVDGQKETTPLYDEQGKTSRNPDAGVGIKYNLEKKIRLVAGQHRIIFGLLEESYLTEVEVSLKEGETPVLEFRPRYRHKKNPYVSTFLKGLNSYETLLNGQLVQREKE